MKRAIRISFFLVFCLLVLLLINRVMAWFTGIYNDSVDADAGVVGAYFAGGDGSYEDPYEIKNSRHLRNLSLLQNNGRFDKDNPNDTNGKYYFKVIGTTPNGSTTPVLDVTGTWIPPIGSNDYPFDGTFLGNNTIIKGLRVTTNKSLNGSAREASDFSNVGFFGQVASGASISNFTLDDIYVDHSATIAGNSGIIAGYAPKSSIKYVGVYTARLGYQESVSANSKYALIGSFFNADVLDTAEIPDPGDDSGGSGGDGPDGDVGQFIPDDFYDQGIAEGTSLNYISSASSSSVSLKNNYWIVPDKTGLLGLGSFSFATGAESSAISLDKVEEFFYMSGEAETYQNNSTYKFGASVYGAGYSPASADITRVDMINSSSDAAVNAIKNKIVNGNNVMSSIRSYMTFEGTADATLPSSLSVVGESSIYGQEGSLNIPAASYNVYSYSVKVSITTENPKVFVIASGGNGNRALGVYKLSSNSGTYDKFLSEGGSISENDLSNVNNVSGFTKNYPILSMIMPQPSKAFVCSTKSCNEFGIQNNGTPKCTICGTNMVKYDSIVEASSNAKNDDVVMACEFDLSGFGTGTYLFSSTGSRIRIYYLSVEGVSDGDTGGGDEPDTETIEVEYIQTVDFVNQGTLIDQAYTNYSYILLEITIINSSVDNDTIIYIKRKDEDVLDKVFYKADGTGATVKNKNEEIDIYALEEVTVTDYPNVVC